MIFTALPTGAAVFVDANPLIYHFSGHPQFGAACTAFLERIEPAATPTSTACPA